MNGEYESYRDCREYSGYEDDEYCDRESDYSLSEDNHENGKHNDAGESDETGFHDRKQHYQSGGYNLGGDDSVLPGHAAIRQPGAAVRVWTPSHEAPGARPSPPTCFEKQRVSAALGIHTTGSMPEKAECISDKSAHIPTTTPGGSPALGTPPKQVEYWPPWNPEYPWTTWAMDNYHSDDDEEYVHVPQAVGAAADMELQPDIPSRPLSRKQAPCRRRRTEGSDTCKY
jgi:hypothetical protein